MKKIGTILLILIVCLCGCLTPQTVIKIYPPDENGVKKVVIDQKRLGKTTYKDKDGIECSYDSKDKSIFEDIMKIYSLKIISED